MLLAIWRDLSDGKLEEGIGRPCQLSSVLRLLHRQADTGTHPLCSLSCRAGATWTGSTAVRRRRRAIENPSPAVRGGGTDRGVARCAAKCLAHGKLPVLQIALLPTSIQKSPPPERRPFSGLDHWHQHAAGFSAVFATALDRLGSRPTAQNTATKRRLFEQNRYDDKVTAASLFNCTAIAARLKGPTCRDPLRRRWQSWSRA